MNCITIKRTDAFSGIENQEEKETIVKGNKRGKVMHQNQCVMSEREPHQVVSAVIDQEMFFHLSGEKSSCECRERKMWMCLLNIDWVAKWRMKETCSCDLQVKKYTWQWVHSSDSWFIRVEYFTQLRPSLKKKRQKWSKETQRVTRSKRKRKGKRRIKKWDWKQQQQAKANELHSFLWLVFTTVK